MPRSHSVFRIILAGCLALSLLLFLPDSASISASPTIQIPPASTTPSSLPSPTTTKPILLTDPIADPHQDGVQYFPQTGHTLRGSFLQYWQQYGGLVQFGYPLTEEFFEPAGSNNIQLRVQYFERNRFEYHPELAEPFRVSLGLLGVQVLQARGWLDR